MTIITGTASNETLNGDDQDNVIRGLAGNDRLFGGGGDDLLDGGIGNDLLDGGAGIDTATYAEAANGVIVNLGLTISQSTLFGRDTLISIENVIGSSFADTLLGNAGDNVIDGGAGIDQVSYAGATAGVVVDLGRTDQQDTLGAGRDRLVAIENLLGSAFDDLLAGNAGNNTLGGGTGIDTLTYAAATAGVVVNLGVNFQQDTIGAGRDTLFGFENLIGSAFNDILYGNAGNNVLDGAAGIDTLSYVEATAGVTVSLALAGEQDTVGAGRDTITRFENLTGSAFDDVIAGNSGANILRGGGGIDTVSYAAASVGVSVNLVAGSAYEFEPVPGFDMLFGFENIIGSAFDDSLAGDNNDNFINAGDGNDRIEAFGGRNMIVAGNGDDVLFSSADAIDQVDGGAGIDRWRLGGAVNALDLVIDGTQDTLVLPNGTTVTEVEIFEIFAGASDDSFTLSNLFSDTAGIVVNIVGGEGSDRLSLDQSADIAANTILIGVFVDAGPGFAGSSSNGNVTLSYVGIETIEITASAQDDLFIVDDTAPLAAGASLQLDGGAGFDILNIDFEKSPGASFVVAANGDITSNRGNFGNFERFDIVLGSGSNLVRTGAGDDQISAYIGGDDLIDGGDGHDIVRLSAFQSDFAIVRNGLGGFAYFGPVNGVIGFHRFENIERIELFDAVITSLALAGSAGIDSLAGTSLIDLLDGLAGDDTLTGFGGNDILDGGTGVDTAVYRGNRENYLVTIAAGSVRVEDLRTTASDGIDMLTGIEILAFADQTLVVGNRPPTGATLATTTVAENSPAGTLVGTVVGIDPDVDDVLIFTLTDDADGRFAIDATTGAITVGAGANLDFETATSHAITLRITDAAGANADIGFTIGVVDVSEGPTQVYTGNAFNNVFTVTDDNGWTLSGLSGADKLTGGARADILVGGTGNDILKGGAGNDRFQVTAGDGVDNIDGGAGFDTLVAASANAVIAVNALVGIEVIDAAGFTGVKLAGSAGNDNLDLSQTLLTGITSINGAAGNDAITGSTAADLILGGAGADILAGGLGADIFAYSLTIESGVGVAKADRIVDFTPGEDRIDLSAIDAINGLSGNQTFVFIGSAAFTALGQLRIGFDDNGDTAVFGNTSGSLAADFQISLTGDTALGVTDFLL